MRGPKLCAGIPQPFGYALALPTFTPKLILILITRGRDSGFPLNPIRCYMIEGSRLTRLGNVSFLLGDTDLSHCLSRQVFSGLYGCWSGPSATEAG